MGGRRVSRFEDRDPVEDDDRMAQWADDWQAAYDRLVALGVLDETDTPSNTFLPEMQRILAVLGEAP